MYFINLTYSFQNIILHFITEILFCYSLYKFLQKNISQYDLWLLRKYSPLSFLTSQISCIRFNISSLTLHTHTSPHTNTPPYIRTFTHVHTPIKAHRNLCYLVGINLSFLPYTLSWFLCRSWLSNSQFSWQKVSTKYTLKGLRSLSEIEGPRERRHECNMTIYTQIQTEQDLMTRESKIDLYLP